MKKFTIRKKVLALMLLSLVFNFSLQGQDTIMVTKTTDPDQFLYRYNYVDSLCAPEMLGTLQWAIRKANDSPADSVVIVINIPGLGPHVIYLNNYLPMLMKPITIDGSTQPGYNYSNGPSIIIDGTYIPYNSACFNTSGSSGRYVIKGLLIRNFYLSTGIYIWGSNSKIINNVFQNVGGYNPAYYRAMGIYIAAPHCIIQGNVFGTGITGTENHGSSAEAIYLQNQWLPADNCIIGGSGVNEPNIIANSGWAGISIVQGKHNRISRNKIYNNPTGINLAIGAGPTWWGNEGKTAPVITSATNSIVSGTSAPNDIIEIFGSSGNENINEYLGTTITDANSDWTINNVQTSFNYIVATATDTSNNTSALSDTLKAFQGCIYATQTAYPLNSVTSSSFLTVCTKYKIDYLLSKNPDSTYTSSNITINLPYGITFDSLLNTDTVTSTSLPGTSNPVFTVNWSGNQTLISIIIETPPCAPDSIVQTTIIDSNCSSITSFVSPILPLVSPSLFVQNTANGPLQVNTGDVEELVFKIQNNSTYPLDIPLINILLSPDQTIQLLGNYYFTNLPDLLPQHTFNIYTYNANPAEIPFTGNNISIGQPDFNYIFGAGVNSLQKDSLFYLHIPYIANSCAQAGGSYIFTWSCASACHIDTITSEINIVAGGSPNMQVKLYPHENGTYCPSGNTKTTVEMGFEYKNTGYAITGNGVPTGNAKATNLQLYIFNDTTIGTVNDTFKIFFGSDTVNVPGIWQPALSIYGLKVYLIDFSTLAVGSNLNGSPLLWNPLGSGNTLADLDGDGFVDDISDSGTFTITTKYTYKTSCPSGLTNSQCFSNAYNILRIRSRYNNQCFTLNSNDYPQNTFYVGNPPDGYYSYSNHGYPVQIPLPPDVLEVNPEFTVNINPGTYFENWSPYGFDFDCPNGHHQLKLTLPAGYHLNTDTITNGLTYIGAGIPGTSSTVFQMPLITAWCNSACNNTPGLSQTLNPTIQEFCSQGSIPAYILINFGQRINKCSCSNQYSETYQLKDSAGNNIAINAPIIFGCSDTNIVCGGTQTVDPFGNTADVFNSQMQFVCDTSCSSCATGIICSSGSTFHHCLGECGLYFSTDANSFTFLRQNVGYENANPLYYPCAPLFNPVPAVPPAGSLSLAYPGDVIKTTATGSFYGTITNEPVHTGSDYQNIYLQIRYDKLPEATDDVLFDLDTTQGKIRITNSSDTTGNTFIDIPSSDITLSSFVDSGIVHLNFNISQAGLNFINDSTVLFTFNAELFLIARTHLNNSTALFYTQGKNPLTSLRAEFMGTRTNMPLVEDHSCDSWGANFTMLQPFSNAGIYPTGNTTCDVLSVRFFLETQRAEFYSDDFPAEFRAYSALDPQDTIIIPPGYKYLSSTFYILYSAYDTTGGINGFDPTETNTNPLYFPITPVYYTNNPNITDTLIYNGINSLGINCWPLLDLKRHNGSHPWYIIYVNLQPLCYASPTADIKFSGGFTDNISSPYSQYKVHRNFNYTSYVSHINPLLSVVPPQSSIDAFDNKVTFNFKICNQPGAVANSSWVAIENSLSNSLNLSSAIVRDSITGNTLQTNIYTDNNNNQALLVNTGTILTSVCKTYSLTASINNPDGCVNGNDAVPDYINVFIGNECNIPFDSLTSPDALCSTDTTYKFNFKRYPSKLELLTDSNSIPLAPVDLCAGSLTYQFILSSSLLGTITNPTFQVGLPNGITVNAITFTYPFNSTNVCSPPVSGNFGTPGNPGWNIDSCINFTALADNGLIGNTNVPYNQVLVTITLNTHCGYNVNDSIKFYAGGISSCSENLTTDTIKHSPNINNILPADNLSIVTTMTTNDGSPFINCTNKGAVIITVINNDTTANIHNDVLTVNVPAPPLNLSYILLGGTYDSIAGTLSWIIPSGSLNGEDSLLFLYGLTTNGIICDSFLITPAISYTYTVICSDSSVCPVTYSYTAEPITITACCLCQASVSSQTGVSCSGGSNGTATVTGTAGIPPYSYQWNNGQTTATAINLSTGTYDVTVTDSTGCFSVVYVTITNDFLPPPTTSIFISDTNCIKQGVPVQFYTSSLSGEIHTWSFGDGTTATGDTVNHTFTDFGYFQISLSASNLCGSDTSCNVLFVNPSTYNCYTVYDIPNDTILSGNVIWSSDTIKVKGDVYIPNGTSLNIANITVLFAPRSRLIAGKGGRLVIDNAVLDGIDNCMWQGIEVWGQPDSASTDSLQGRVYITNNSSITNAYIGVLLGNRIKYTCNTIFTAAYGSFNSQNSGGVIVAKNSTFAGNATDIRFVQKSNPDGIANVLDTLQFICPDTLKDPHYNPSTVNPYRSDRNPWATFANSNQRTYWGIVSVCISNLNIRKCTFRNLEYGISSLSNQQTYVSDCEFKNLRQGIHINNHLPDMLNFYDITLCTFDSIPGNTAGNVPSSSPEDNGTAIYIAGGIGDKINDGNIFRNNYPGTAPTYGIKTNQAFGFEIANNVFNGLAIGITIQGSAANGGKVMAKASSSIFSWQGNQFNQCKTGITTKIDNSALCLRCNDHNNNLSNYIINWKNEPGSILANQGFTGWIPNLITPANSRYGAGNKFFPINYNKIGSVSTYNYYYHSTAGYEPDTTGSPLILKMPTGIPIFTKLESCPFPPPFNISIINLPVSLNAPVFLRIDSLNNVALNLESQYLTLLNNADKGHTIELLNAINAVPPTGQLKNMLISDSPLSDTVLITLNNQNPLSNGNYKNVMDENLPVTRNVVPSFISRVETLPAGIKNQLKAKQASNPGKITSGYLETMLNQAKLTKQLYFNEIISLLLESNRKADAITLYEKEGTPTANMVLAATYLSDSNYSTASAKIALLPDDNSQYSLWKAYSTLLLNHLSQGKTLEDLDSNQIAYIRTIAYECPEGMAVVNAKAILMYLFMEQVPSCSENGTRSMRFGNNQIIEIKKSYLGDNYPDPFSRNTIIPYYLPEGTKAEIIIKDVTGRIILCISLHEGENKLEIDSKNWANGVYFYGMSINGENIDNKKMVKTE